MKKFFIFLAILVSWSGFANSKIDQIVIDSVPEPVYAENPEYVDLYYQAWQIAQSRKFESPGMPQSPYMDEGLTGRGWDDVIWIWDTCFMSLFTRYSPEYYPGLESLQNFYIPLHDPNWMEKPKEERQLVIWHPDNPPLFSWVEYDNYLFSADEEHIRKLLLEDRFLQKHYAWFNNVKPGWSYKGGHKYSAPVYKKTYPLGYTWGGVASGMDNTPRGRGYGYSRILWVDAISQQGLSALYLSRMLESIGEVKEAAEWKAEYERLKQIVNKYYWDEEDGFYYDISRVGRKFSKVITPASYWPLIAEMASEDQARRAIEKLTDPSKLGGARPTPTVAIDDRAFDVDGNYWKGSIWLPTTYMTVKALEKYGYYDLAHEISIKINNQILETWKNYSPQTIWENYSPTKEEPGSVARPEFCGWSALGPVSMFIENIIGIRSVDALKNEIIWDLRSDKEVGIKKLKFAETETDLIIKDKKLKVKTNKDYTLFVNGKEYKILSGDNEFDIE